MILPAEPENMQEALPLEWSGEAYTVARQPILNQGGRLHAYELLFRDNTGLAANVGGEAVIGPLVDDTVVFGLERFTNGFPAFVACTAEALTGQLLRILPPDRTILTLPESTEPTTELMDACRDLKTRGFRIAVDDFTGKIHPLIELVDYVRVDFSRHDAAGCGPISQWLGNSNAAMVAKKVATDEEYRRAVIEGFTLFQGDYLFRPVMVKNRKVPANRLFHFEILRNLYRDSIDLRKLGQLVMRDASLTYRLLRLVNSPICAIRQEVRSVESALIIVGIDTFRRFATLAILGECSTNDQPEILRAALLRARFCELAARMARQDPAEQYLLGMFSLLPVMLRSPISELTPALPLREDVRHALEGAQNSERCLLSWLEHHERGEWSVCDELVRDHRLSHERLIRSYADSVVWANAALRSTESGANSAETA